ncbi:hypothetical protein [Vibrio diazotrophicus]|uniref:hypothetical protein n=1 Tax=Vibrio diazotrophicus TaxID=685 RepID=UPI000C9E6C5D|nr:hypothetical protein [Vibrio diazotrophicus]PNH81950.1 hypothetical protein C1N27_04420 [Vibrio diazotrophicus]
MKLSKTHLNSITTIILITLSWLTHASQCNEQDWNKALVSQQALDRKYNSLAQKYNKWLPSFQQSIFLHLEFSNQELTYLWAKNSNHFRSKIDRQIEAALESRQKISSLVSYLDEISQEVTTQISAWNKIGQDCEVDRLITNEVAAQHYVQSNRQLIQEFTNFKQQLFTMRSYYDREILTLQNITAPIPP